MFRKGPAHYNPRLSPASFARLSATIVAAASVLAGRALVAAGLRRAPEGWRRTVGVLLRSEPTRFALSAFGLRVPSSPERAGASDALEDRVARGLLSFLAQEPDAHFSLEPRPRITVRQRVAFVDVVVLRFTPDGTLAGLRAWLSGAGSRRSAEPDVQERVHSAVIEAYNRTAGLAEIVRLPRLRGEVRARIPPSDFSYADRILAASCLVFEPRDVSNAAARFSPPAFSKRRGLGFGYLSWVARPDPDANTVDLWVSAHHVGLDGVPLQDLLGRLERTWGTVPVLFPAATGSAAFSGPHPCHVQGERAVDQLTMFVDLAPVLALRRSLSSRFGSAVGGEVTLGALIAWLLSQEPEFAGVRIASTVDVAASGGYERDVDVVSLRPADYMNGPGPWDGFAAFAREFNRLVGACRTRTSPVRVGMQAAGLIPAWAHATLVRSNPAALDDTFGTLCVTIIREARVFIAPMTDLGLRLGFFAIGSAALPSTDGTFVTSVSVKGEAGRIGSYPAILQRAIARAAALESAPPLPPTGL